MTLPPLAETLSRGDPDRFAALLAMPPAARDRLLPLYAFNLEIARAPWVTAEPVIAEMRLQWWRDTVAEIGEGRPPRAHEVAAIQQDILRRRRRSLLFLTLRLAVFVLLPTVLAGIYFARIATPLYATRSEFIIQQADAQASSGLGGLFAGAALATHFDSITVQGYLQSREAMLRLDAELGFRAAFQGPGMDLIQRLDPDASNEDAYRIYQRNVKISFDPTEGVIRMEVRAPDPELSAAFSRALVTYAEEQVDALTQRLREDQMRGARDSYDEAEANMRAAQAQVLALQARRGVLSADAEVGTVMAQIAALDARRLQEELALRELRSVSRPNAARVRVTEANIARLGTMIAELRQGLTADAAGGTSLAQIAGELSIAEAELQTRQALLAQALEQLESARIEANRQVRYLSVGVSPIPPDEPTYPRAFENTLVTFLIFTGIYLMISLTASILREQVSA